MSVITVTGYTGVIFGVLSGIDESYEDDSIDRTAEYENEVR